VDGLLCRALAIIRKQQAATMINGEALDVFLLQQEGRRRERKRVLMAAAVVSGDKKGSNVQRLCRKRKRRRMCSRIAHEPQRVDDTPRFELGETKCARPRAALRIALLRAAFCSNHSPLPPKTKPNRYLARQPAQAARHGRPPKGVAQEEEV
jgi:hypothetical protein